MQGCKIGVKGRIFVVQIDAGPSGASNANAVTLFHSDDLTSSSSSLEILSRRLLAPLQKMKKKLFDQKLLNRCSVYLWVWWGRGIKKLHNSE